MAPAVLHRVCYGTTQPSEVQQSRLRVRPAVLHGYERHRVKESDYPGIVPSSVAGATVRGTIASGLTDGDLWRLDIFEGDEYERHTVDAFPLEQVGAADGTGSVEAAAPERVQAYIFTAGEDELEPGEWDFADFVRTKMARWAGSAEEYLEVDEAVEAQAADPTKGRSVDGSVSQKLREEQKVGDGRKTAG